MVESGEPILVQDVSRDERFLHYRGMLTGIGSFLSVPLVGGDGQVFGVLNIHKAETHAFREKEKQFFCAVAHNLAVALERARLFDNARREAMHDDLTGLYNRRYFFDCAERELNKSRRGDAVFSLAVLDIDHFKNCNDTFGHSFGDRVLRELAATLKAGIRQSDILARYGGEEFALLLPETTLENACGLLEKLRQKVAAELAPEPRPGQGERITFTAGVAAFPEDGESVAELFAAADHRLYQGKGAGRDRVMGRAPRPVTDAAGANRRRYPRRRTMLQVVNDSRQVARAIHAIDILIRDRWLPCVPTDVSREGFNSLVGFEPRAGDDYLCRAVLDPRNGTSPRFAIRVRHVEPLNDNRFLMGVQVGGGDVSAWRCLYSSLIR